MGGKFVCPSAPKELLEASQDFYLRAKDDPKRIDRATYEERVERLKRYVLTT